MKTGIELIAQERNEQIEKHGYTPDHDANENDAYQLSKAMSFMSNKVLPSILECLSYKPYAWDKHIWLKMCEKPYKDRIVIVGAWAAAELDRLNYNS